LLISSAGQRATAKVTARPARRQPVFRLFASSTSPEIVHYVKSPGARKRPARSDPVAEFIGDRSGVEHAARREIVHRVLAFVGWTEYFLLDSNCEQLFHVVRMAELESRLQIAEADHAEVGGTERVTSDFSAYQTCSPGFAHTDTATQAQCSRPLASS
jgi:hypothetical protein